MSARLLLLTPNLDNNSLGRTYCLWLLARACGMSVTVASPKGERVWAPLAEHELAAACHRVAPLEPGGSLDPRLLAMARDCDLVVAVKPVENSFGLGLALTRATGRPLLLDVDDPDIEVRTTWLPWPERAARRLLTPRYRTLRRLRQEATRVPLLVSNPELQRMYGGRLVPHVREAAPAGAPSASRHPVVRFVGSVRPHKGVDVLRAAVARLHGRGFTLEVTGAAPPDTAPWERWLGTTSLAEGERLVATADVVAVPSLASEWSPAQLPVKLVDALTAGACVVASHVGPVPWALDGSGVLVPPGDVDALTDALAGLADPARRAELGRRARTRALQAFSVEAVAPVFAEEVAAACRTSATA
ncbi:glycosyltransferase family 4 protein [Aquipuribacter nitratireducens]|uniref:Glycosyltransferase family 4 protein n=1 Tax=Aquipuribacter nitratireducens TaxID=650104 RepID=A0ABW0GUR7_9MICO